MRFDGNFGRAKNYKPNSYDGPAQSNERHDAPMELYGVTGAQKATLHAEDNDFVQAGDLYRLMTAE
jgi:catalase